MRSLGVISVGLALVAAASGAPGARADEMTLPDGKRQQGTLELDSKGRLCLTAPGQPAPIPLAELQEVRFPAGRLPPGRTTAVYQVALPAGQRLSGELVELNDKGLTLHTAWKDGLVVPRQAVLAVAHPPGWVTVLDEDFEGGLKAWRLAAVPAPSDRQRTSGRRSLLLDTPGQSAEYTLADPVEAGRADISFFDPGTVSGARWLLEAEFGTAKEPWLARVVIASQAEHYEAEAPGAAGTVKPVARTPGWHRLSLRFGPDYLLIGVDERLLWSSGKQRPGGLLRKVRLACAALPDGGAVRGAVFFDDLVLARAVDERPHRIEDAGQDEAWLLAGDQLLGKVARADRRAIELQAGSGVEKLTWGQVRGLYLRREVLPPRTTEGEHVRVWLRGAGGEPDELEGVLQALDERRLALRHPLLGELVVERGRVHKLQHLFHGRRVELDNGPHHLGETGRVVAGLEPPRAAGVSLRRTFRLDAVPAEARLVVGVVHLKGPADGIGPALERGELRTEVIVNGQRVDYLNRHVEGAAREPRTLRVTLPRRCLQAGENVLELRQTPDRTTERSPSCGIIGLALEVPRGGDP